MPPTGARVDYGVRGREGCGRTTTHGTGQAARWLVVSWPEGSQAGASAPDFRSLENEVKGIPSFTGSSGPHQCPTASLALQKCLGRWEFPAHMVLIKKLYEKHC